MDIILLITAMVLLLIGIIGSIVPVIPGPPLSYLGMLLLHFSKYANFSTRLLLIYAAISIIVTVLDYIIPIYGTKKMGGTSYGVWGTSIGLVIGLFFFPPLGIIIGPFLGAFIGEIIYGQTSSLALVAAIGSFLGFLFGTLIKLITSIMITYHCLKYLFFI